MSPRKAAVGAAVLAATLAVSVHAWTQGGHAATTAGASQVIGVDTAPVSPAARPPCSGRFRSRVIASEPLTRMS